MGFKKNEVCDAETVRNGRGEVNNNETLLLSLDFGKVCFCFPSFSINGRLDTLEISANVPSDL
jgi:hypothetical protein